ncbi:MAG: hypothetical protein WBL39_21185 [Terrimicrobiaceae bacterium]
MSERFVAAKKLTHLYSSAVFRRIAVAWKSPYPFMTFKHTSLAIGNVSRGGKAGLHQTLGIAKARRFEKDNVLHVLRTGVHSNDPSRNSPENWPATQELERPRKETLKEIERFP